MDNIFGIVINNKFYSNRMEFKVNIANGIYSLDMSKDDFKSHLNIADIEQAIKFFRKSSKINVIKGISFHDNIVPENPVSFKKIPLKVLDATFDEWEEIEVVSLQNGIVYFLRNIFSNKSYAIMDAKNCFDKNDSIVNLKGITPEIKMVFTFHNLEKLKIEMEKKRQEELIPEKIIEKLIEGSNAKFISFKKVNRGYEVLWESDGHMINTLLNNNYGVIEAGFCVSGYDRTQSLSSVTKLLKDYVEEGSYIHKTRTTY